MFPRQRKLSFLSFILGISLLELGVALLTNQGFGLCALTLGVAGMIIEVFPIKNFDNITLPILIAFMSLFFIY